MARTTLAKVRSLLTFQEAKAGVEPKNMKITYAAKMLRKRLKKAAAAARKWPRQRKRQSKNDQVLGNF
jgi:hypothetical protein